jgi:hypothetical protein
MRAFLPTPSFTAAGIPGKRDTPPRSCGFIGSSSAEIPELFVGAAYLPFSMQAPVKENLDTGLRASQEKRELPASQGSPEKSQYRSGELTPPHLAKAPAKWGEKNLNLRLTKENFPTMNDSPVILRSYRAGTSKQAYYLLHLTRERQVARPSYSRIGPEMSRLYPLVGYNIPLAGRNTNTELSRTFCHASQTKSSVGTSNEKGASRSAGSPFAKWPVEFFATQNNPPRDDARAHFRPNPFQL